MNGKWVDVPNLEIRFHRGVDGVFRLKAACHGEFHTENEATAMSVFAEWRKHQDRIIGEIQEQNAEVKTS